MFAVYALAEGIVFCQAELGGYGSPITQPAVSGGAYLVAIGSDSEGMFGRRCPGCNGHWRGKAHAA